MYQSTTTAQTIAKKVKVGCAVSLATTLMEPSASVSTFVSMIDVVQKLSVCDISSIADFERRSVYV